jgi:hypothetical protein
MCFQTLTNRATILLAQVTFKVTKNHIFQENLPEMRNKGDG